MGFLENYSKCQAQLASKFEIISHRITFYYSFKIGKLENSEVFVYFLQYCTSYTGTNYQYKFMWFDKKRSSPIADLSS